MSALGVDRSGRDKGAWEWRGEAGRAGRGCADAAASGPHHYAREPRAAQNAIDRSRRARTQSRAQ